MLDSDGVVALPSTSAPATNTDYQFRLQQNLVLL